MISSLRHTGPVQIFNAAIQALRQIVSPPFRRMLLRSVGLTLLILGLVWFGLTRLLNHYLASHSLSASWPILDTLAFFVAGAGLMVGLAFLIPPVSALVSGYYLDDAAELVEKTDYPEDPPGKPLSVGLSLLYGLRFAGLSLVINLFALLLFFIPGVNMAAFFIANGYLLGREYFEMAAARFRPMAEAEAMRLRNRATVFGAGLVAALLVAVPVLNLLTPLFGIALMVHVHKSVQRAELAAPQGTAAL
ncbi:cysteine biosynthesis protein [Camelimonas fluminis]|uniref:Sulfate transporter family protein n=1 Tax=Camelimonas fluminis TaxID=1576911 RepID=A0ABV7UNB0_9HYPH|nr:sulfate transporter family protein [Camelimonas fluminis]GHE69194.1 cysteine biosynthesis protein [Camelimonas fluminis]